MYLRTTQFIPQVTYSRQLGGLFDKLLDTGSKIYAGQTAKSIAKAQAKTAAAQEALVARQAELEARIAESKRAGLLSNPLVIGGAVAVPLLLMFLRKKGK